MWVEEQRNFTDPTRLPPPRAAQSMSLITSTVVLLGLSATGLIPVSQVVVTAGRVVSKEPTILVQSFDKSILQSITVQPGDLVRSGQIIAEFDPTFADADNKTREAQVSALQAQEQRLRAEVEDRPFAYIGSDPRMSLQAAIFAQRQADYNLKVESYRHKRESAAATVIRLQADIASYRDRAAYAREVVAVRRQLEQLKLGSKLSTLQALDTLAEAERNLASAEHAGDGAQQDMASLVAESNAFAQNWHSEAAEKLAEVASKLSDARNDLSKAQLHNQLVTLRAPRDCIVLSLSKVSIGSVLSPGQQIMSLVPADAPLEVEANIPAAENGYVHPGDSVAIKFDTLPYSTYGMAHGVVRTVSPDSFTIPDEQRNPTGAVLPPANAAAVWYRARITLDRVGLRNAPQGFHLVPGMPVTADILVGSRTVLRYVIGRAVPLIAEGMREPQ
jgi:hemolysin D